MWRALVAEHPVGPRSEAVEEGRAREVDVGEGREEEALDAAGEADRFSELLALLGVSVASRSPRCLST